MNSRNKTASLLICIAVVSTSAAYLVLKTKLAGGAARQVYNGVLDLEPDPLLEPSKIFDVHGVRLSKQLYSALVAYDDQYTLVGGLASEWKISADGKEYSFSLKPDLFFHDGSRVKAADIVDSLRLLGKGGSVRQDMWKYVRSINAKSDRDIEIRLAQKFAPFLEVLASSAAGIRKNSSQPTPYRPIGTGPYRVREWIPGKRITLERSPYYHGPVSRIAEINFYLLRNPQEIRNLLKTTRLHDLGWYNPDIGEYKNDYVELEVPSLKVAGIFFNLSKPPFNDSGFRSELVRAIDKKELIKQVYPGSIIAKGYLPYGLLGHNAGLPVSLYDPDGPSRLLRAHKKKVTIRAVIKDPDEFRGMSEFIQKTFRRFSLDVRLVNASEREAYDAFVSGDYEAFVLSNEAGFPDASAMLSCFGGGDSPGSFSRYSDKEYDLLLIKSHLTDDRNERAKIYEKMDEFLVRHHYLLPLFYNSKKKKFHKSVRGINMSLLGEHLIDISRLSLE